MSKEISGCCAFVGSWMTLVAVGDFALGLEDFSVIMFYGIVVYYLCSEIRKWIEN